VAGEYFDAIHGCDDVALDAACVKDFVSLERSIDLDQHSLQTFHIKAAQAVAQNIVTESTVGSDPTLEGRLGQFRFYLLETRQPEHEAMKG
jgi:hypothetical protein